MEEIRCVFLAKLDVRWTVSFVQQGEQLDEGFLRRYLPFKQGDPYNTALLLSLQTALSDSDHFSRIEIHQLFHYWHVFHKPFALIMYIVMVIHVTLTTIFGYTWIF